MAAFSPEFLNRLSELGNEYQRLSEKHEQLQQQEQQLHQQKQKLQEEVEQLQEGRVLLVTENRSLIEKLQEITEEKQQLQQDLNELREDKHATSLQLAERNEEIIKLQEQLRAQNAAHEREILKHNEKHEQMQRENAELSDKLKNLNKKRQDLTDQLRLATEEQQRQSEEISSLTSEKQQLLDLKKQQIEENRLLAGRVRTLTAKQKHLQEEKHQAVSSLRKQQEEQQQRWERRVRSLEQLRDETLTQLKSLEEEKARETEECARQAAEKQEWQSKAAALERQLQQTTLELHRVEDALNTEKNIVEENKQRHQLDMQDCICRAAEQQNALKQTFAADYRRACDEIERCSREKHHLVESVLEFARAHGCAYYSERPFTDCGEASNSSGGRRRRRSSSSSSTRASPSYRSAANESRGSAASDAETAPASPSTAAAAAWGNREQQPTVAADTAASEEPQRLQGTSREKETGIGKTAASSASAGASSCVASPVLPPPSSACSSTAVPATLRLIGARLAALEAAAHAANEEQKRISEERNALQKALSETAEKARAAADARQQLALRFSSVMRGIRELSEKAAFEQQLVRPLLDPLQRCCPSLSSSHNSSTFAHPLLSSRSCDVEGGAAGLPSATSGPPVAAEARSRSVCDTVGTCAPAAALDRHATDGYGVTQRADATVHERIYAGHFAGRVRSKDVHEKEERSAQEFLRSGGCRYTGGSEEHTIHASRDVTHLAAPVAAHRAEEEEEERNQIKGGLLCSAHLRRGSEAEFKPHEGAVSTYSEKEGHMRRVEDPDTYHVYGNIPNVQYDCGTAPETHVPRSIQSHARWSGECAEKQNIHRLKSEGFLSTSATSTASGTMQCTADTGFPARKNSAEERSTSPDVIRTLATVPHPSRQDLHTHYVSGSWDKRDSGDAEGQEEETTTDSSRPSTVSGHHSNSNESAFAVFDPCMYTPERGVKAPGGHDR